MTWVAFAPLVPWAAIVAVGAIALLLLAFGAFRRARGVWWRALGLAALIAGLANPVLVEEERKALPDVALVVVDDSPSQGIGNRRQETEAALARVHDKLGAMEDLEARVVRAGAPQAADGKPADGTRLFESLNRALATVPKKRLAGTIMITDGQVHDTPKEDVAAEIGAPVHSLITGRRGERDRRIVVEDAPAFAIVGKDVDVRIRVDDPGAEGQRVRVAISRGEGAPEQIPVAIGQAQTLKLRFDHAGQNIVQFDVDAGQNELTTINNRAVVSINGVRERLRVLLVSGEPHPGERVWRNLLKSDPSIDLVHFTILRPPEKQDGTPVRELSLISFPIRELFEVKLDEFDLIIFDKYKLRGVLPSLYLENVVKYVERGGAVLEAAGPEFGSPLGLYRTPLGVVLPTEPTGRNVERGFRPILASAGQRHPITADLPGVEDEYPRWGRWFRFVGGIQRRGNTLMNGPDNMPLLVVDRVGKGRVAQILSDQIWLWSRGFEGGGPHAELLRRLGHWLMKEPELEENDLRASYDGSRLNVVRRSLEPDTTPVTVTAPSGEAQTVTLEQGAGGRARAQVEVKESGIYRVKDANRETLAAVGTLNPREYADMRATADLLTPVARATGGGVYWLQDGMPDLRRARAGRRMAGDGWAALVANHDYSVQAIREAPMLPGLALLFLGLGALMFAWRREGR